MAQIFTGSKDETVRVWEAASGKCASVVQVGGHVDSLLMESGFLFVGMHITNAPDKPGLIKVRRSPGGTAGCHACPSYRPTKILRKAGGQYPSEALRLSKEQYICPCSVDFLPQVVSGCELQLRHL